MSVSFASSQDGGVSNLAIGTITGEGEAAIVNLGFMPRYVKLFGLTTLGSYEYLMGLEAGHVFATGADGAITDNDDSVITVSGEGSTFRGFTVPAAIAVEDAVFHFIAFG